MEGQCRMTRQRKLSPLGLRVTPYFDIHWCYSLSHKDNSRVTEWWDVNSVELKATEL